MENSTVWFSQKEKVFDEFKDIPKIFSRRRFTWRDEFQVWDWNNCTVSAVKLNDNKLRIIIRSEKTVHSKFRQRDVKLKYMLGFDLENEISPPKTEEYNQPPGHNSKKKTYGLPKPRWVLQLDDSHWIGQWVENHPLENSSIYQIYLMLNKVRSEVFSESSIFNVVAPNDNRIIPVVYQPAVDAWKNFLREVHCYKINEGEYEITLIFNDEELKEHAIFNKIYRWIRLRLYRRLRDVETFRILLKENIPEDFTFEGIYSGKYTIENDSIHGDKRTFSDNIQNHKIKYYFVDKKHPIVFINTSNHAMAESDNNHNLWKWEYIAWGEDSPVSYGQKSREQINDSFKNKK